MWPQPRRRRKWVWGVAVQLLLQLLSSGVVGWGGADIGKPEETKVDILFPIFKIRFCRKRKGLNFRHC